MAQAAASPLRHLTRPWLLPRPTTSSIAAQLSSLFPHHSPPRRFSAARGLRPSSTPLPPPETEPLADADGDEKKSRNELKREARRAVKWGMELAEFTTPQIERILRAASVEREVFEALLLVKRLGHDVREGKRRQFSYIGRLLRTAEPELMEALIQASKDGDNDKLLALAGQDTSPVEDYEEQETDDDEEFEKYTGIADRWFNGLIHKDPSVTNEVYSIYTVEFDRQELRKLVRQVQSIQGSLAEETGEPNNAKLTRAKKPLVRFLRWLAKESS